MAGSEAASHLTTSSPSKSKTSAYQRRLIWPRVIFFSTAHIIGLYGLYISICGHVQVKTLLFACVLVFGGILGVTAGAHRLWSHKSYSASLPLRIFLALLQLLSLQHSIYDWVRDHRVHHKFTDTDADPHNSSRGIFYSHIGWLLVYKHPDVTIKGRTIDMKDVESDSVVMYQKKYYWYLAFVFSYMIPALIPFYFWNEVFHYSFAVVSILRHVYVWHVTWLINSLAHIWGTKPYNKNISPTENQLVTMLVFGEGWHNYHHSFPWDYKAAELGNYRLNFSTAFIDGCAWLGLAYNLKVANGSMVKAQSLKTGDGTHGGEPLMSGIWDDQLRTLSNDQLKLSGSEQDGSSECVVQSLTDSSGVSFELNKSPYPQKMSCTVNNIYIIGNLNASVIKLGESSFEKVSTTTKTNNPYFPTTFTPTTQTSCDSVDTRSSKSRMPEYFDKGKSSLKPKMISNDHPAGYEHTTDNVIRATCHCHSVKKE